jgi:hypothetical protein
LKRQRRKVKIVLLSDSRRRISNRSDVAAVTGMRKDCVNEALTAGPKQTF